MLSNHAPTDPKTLNTLLYDLDLWHEHVAETRAEAGSGAVSLGASTDMAYAAAYAATPATPEWVAAAEALRALARSIPHPAARTIDADDRMGADIPF